MMKEEEKRKWNERENEWMNNEEGSPSQSTANYSPLATSSQLLAFVNSFCATQGSSLSYTLSVASFKWKVTGWSKCDGVGTVYAAKTFPIWVKDHCPMLCWVWARTTWSDCEHRLLKQPSWGALSRTFELGAELRPLLSLVVETEPRVSSVCKAGVLSPSCIPWNVHF